MLLNLSAELHVGSPAAYPDLTEKDARKKLANKGGWILQYGRAFLSHYLSSGSRDFYHGHKSGRYAEALRYAMGQQDAGQYAVLRDPTDPTSNTDAQRRGKLDKRPLQLLPKYRKAVMGLLKDRDFTPTITALDTLFEEEKDTFVAALRVQMYHGEFIKSLGLGQPTTPDGQPLPATPPLDEEDLDLFIADFKGKGAMKLEIESSKALTKGNYADQDKQCQQDDIVYGSSVVYLARAGTQRVPRRQDPGRCFFLPSDTGLYENLQAGAHLESITLAALLGEMKDADYTPSATELSNLKAKARPVSSTGVYSYDNDLGGMPEAGGTLQVVRFSFLSTDRQVMALGTDKMGNPRWVDKPAGYTNPKNHYADLKTQDVVNVYEGTLVVDTEIGYGARLAHAQLRDPENPFAAHPFYVVTTPDMIGGLSDSLVEQCRPIVDMAARAFVKMQDVFSKIPDAAIAINAGVLAQVVLSGGTPEDPKKLIQAFYRDGAIIYNGIGEQGEILPLPIQQIPIDITNAIAVHRDTISWCVSMIEQITGANGAVAGANVASDQGKGTTELAIQGSQNTLEFLFFAKQSRFERVCRAIVANIKANDPDLAARTMQVKVEQVPTAQEWASFYQNLAAYAAAGQITPEDDAAVRDIKNLKEARRFLAGRAKRKRKMDMEDAQANTDYATQQQTASAEATEQFKQKTLQMQFQLEMQKATFDRETQWGSLERQGQNALQAAQLTSEFRLRGVEATVQGANEREVLKQQNAAEMNEEKLATAEYVAEQKPAPSSAK